MTRIVPLLDRMTIDWVYAPYEIPGRHTGGAEEHVVATHEIVGRQHPVQVVPGRQRLLPLGVVARPQLGLHRPAHALERTRGDDAFGRTSNAHQHIDVAGLAGGADGPRDVAVADEADSRARGPHLADQIGVARPVQDAYRHVGNARVLDLRDAPEVFRHARVDVDDIGSALFPAVRGDRVGV